MINHLLCARHLIIFHMQQDYDIITIKISILQIKKKKPSVQESEVI